MIEKIIQDHISRYQALEIQDLYKLLHQAALGSEHAVSDRASVERWLTQELAELGTGVPEPLVDPISHNGEIVRVHLRPYLAAGHDPRLLLGAFICTANEYRGDVHLLERYWQEAVSMAVFQVHEMDEFFNERKNKGYPAVHHSIMYERHYQPAYRVISLALCPEMQFSTEM